jgi:hypothetical protein
MMRPQDALVHPASDRQQVLSYDLDPFDFVNEAGGANPARCACDEYSLDELKAVTADR